MYKTAINSVAPIELSPGFTARILHSAHMTLSFLDVKAGSVSAEHAHMQEQVAMLTEGEFELTIAGESVRFGPGAVIVIPSNTPHSGRAITDCKLVDIFTPVREDFRALQNREL